MTWYAHEIIFQPTPEVLAVLQAHPVLSQGMYWVRDLEEHTWFNPKAKHGLPPDGLLVMRPVCSPYEHGEWYKTENPIDWFTVNPVPSNQETAKGESVPQPPEALQNYLRQISHDTDSTVAFYQCEMWAGGLDFEKAWVYTPDVNIYTHPYNDNDGIVRFSDHNNEPLLAMLRHFGLELPTTYFALHTRGFPWARYKIPAP